MMRPFTEIVTAVAVTLLFAAAAVEMTAPCVDAHAARVDTVSSSRPHPGTLEPEFERLLDARRKLGRLLDRGRWPRVEAEGALRVGDESPVIQVLRERLAASADLDSASTASFLFDEYLEEAVRSFQRRHGLDDDGIVGRKTLAALNVTVEERIAQVDLNLERWRRLQVPFASRHVRVNIAGFELTVWDGGRRRMRMKVIVGKPRSSTPSFDAEITEIVLAPYWYVPRSIEVNELMPKEAASPGYFQRNGFTRVGGMLRQDPGPLNPMGEIKFLIPNAHGIGLHDTPDRHLFGHAERAFSHGCIRVERPRDLAAYLLAGTGWTHESLESVIARSEEFRIALDRRVPLYVQYWTAWVEPDGTMHFRNDIYGRDEALKQELGRLGARANETSLGAFPTSTRRLLLRTPSGPLSILECSQEEPGP